MIPLNNLFHKQTLQFGSERADFYCIDASPRHIRASSILVLDTNSYRFLCWKLPYSPIPK